MKFAILFSRKTYWGEGYGPNPTSHKPPHLGNSHTSHFSLSQKIWTQTFHMLSPLQEKKKKKKIYRFIICKHNKIPECFIKVGNTGTHHFP